MVGTTARGRILSKKSGTITTDGSGNATGSITGINGKIQGIYVNLITSVGADITLTTELGDVIFNDVSVAADGFYPVMDVPMTNDGSTTFTNSFIEYISCCICSCFFYNSITHKSSK